MRDSEDLAIVRALFLYVALIVLGCFAAGWLLAWVVS